MKKITSMLLAVLICVTSFMGNYITANASVLSAYDVCKSSRTWEEYKENFENLWGYVRSGIESKILKELPKTFEEASTFKGAISYGGIKDEEIEKLEDAVNYAISLYSADSSSHLSFRVTTKDLEGPYSQLDIYSEEIQLTHIGNVVKCYNVPYYSNINEYLTEKNAYYYNGQIVCYTCGVAYWNSDGTLEDMNYVPYNKVAGLKDSEKIEINQEFEGITLVLLCTTNTILGWADANKLFQYEDGTGNMEFYNPEFIYYK